MLFVVAGAMEAAAEGGMDEESAGAVVLGLFTFQSFGVIALFKI